jgi:hypothetical protein
MGRYLTLGLGLWSALLFSNPADAGIESFDWLRGKVNEAWYDAVVGKCENKPTEWSTKTQQDFQQFLNQRGYCASDPQFKNITQLSNLSQQLQEKVFFDAIVVDQAQKNQCLLDYWGSFNLKTPIPTQGMAIANQALMKDHSALKGTLSLNKVLQSKPADALQVQTTILQKMIDAAVKLASKQKQISKMMQDRAPMVDIQALRHEMDLIESSVPMTGDEDGEDYYKNVISASANYEMFTKGKVDEQALLKFALQDPDKSFQKRVVDLKMRKISRAQLDLSKMHGQYNDQHSFKVAAFQKGYGEQLLSGKSILGSEAPFFKQMSCELQSKYGQGAEISSFANQVIAGVATAAIGGGSLVIGRLAQAGTITQSTARIYKIAATASSGAISAAQAAHGLIEGCYDLKAGQNNFSACPLRDSVLKNGLVATVNKDLENSDCTMAEAMAGFSALTSIGSAVKGQVVRSRALAAQNEFRKDFTPVLEKVAARTGSPQQLKEDIGGELERAIASMGPDGRPSEKLLETLNQEDPEGLLTMLKEINTAPEKKTWAEKVRAWLGKKDLAPAEREQLETCLINQDPKVSHYKNGSPLSKLCS